MNSASILLSCLALFVTTGCGQHEDGDHDRGPDADHQRPEEGGEEHAEEEHAGGDEDDHAEHSLGSLQLGELTIGLAQGHGAVEAGKEGHLVVELPYSDAGATTVRAWIGTEDRSRSLVGKGEYAASHDDYDVHATAPDPLPESALWWIEIEHPDGTKLVGSAQPIFE